MEQLKLFDAFWKALNGALFLAAQPDATFGEASEAFRITKCPKEAAARLIGFRAVQAALDAAPVQEEIRA